MCKSNQNNMFHLQYNGGHLSIFYIIIIIILSTELYFTGKFALKHIITYVIQNV